MIVMEQSARELLIVHLVLSGVLVGAATHLAIWMRGFWRGRVLRLVAIRRFAWIVALAFLANIAVGLLAYPSYKVRVRIDYLENTSALLAEYTRLGKKPPEVEAPPTYRAARWFDVKEHVIAMGLATALALLVALGTWDPRTDGTVIARALFGLAVFTAATTWMAAITGAVVTSYRAIGSL
jgi:hypothetical protein